MLVFITLLISYICQAILSIYDIYEGKADVDATLGKKEKVISNMLYAGQFVFQWLSLLIFTLEYLSTEQEVRKVLGMESTKHKREKYNIVSVVFLLVAVIMTYFVCRWCNESFFDSWASSLGESIVAGAIFILQGRMIKKISKLIREADLDLTPVSRSFCRNMSVIGFIFLVQCADFGIHLITQIMAER